MEYQVNQEMQFYTIQKQMKQGSKRILDYILNLWRNQKVRDDNQLNLNVRNNILRIRYLVLGLRQ
ncbi:unnamed protein product [Paramecium sonneborni]|uniref:Uncharacterized protein n=1 Tax=Paramecium sonneborni TaxID=65129 RepID=A0A8S1R9I1_9CILI|nr:unnamed protein product [Paramecium sonneborni]